MQFSGERKWQRNEVTNFVVPDLPVGQVGCFAIYFEQKKNSIEILNIPGPRIKKSQEIHGQIKSIFKNTPEKIYD